MSQGDFSSRARTLKRVDEPEATMTAISFTLGCSHARKRQRAWHVRDGHHPKRSIYRRTVAEAKFGGAKTAVWVLQEILSRSGWRREAKTRRPWAFAASSLRRSRRRPRTPCAIITVGS